MSILRLRADAARIPLADGSVHCVVTSPPYYGLRKYSGVPDSVWGPAHAWRGTLGNEPTVDAYVAHLVAVFRDIRRVMRDDGVCWLNLGDSFSGGGNGGERPGAIPGSGGQQGGARNRDGVRGQPGIPAGNLLGVPWRVAFALQADGWLLRNDVVWAKRAPMPESVSGVRWQRCRVKIARGSVARDGTNGSGQRPHGALIAEPSRAETWPDRPQQDHDGHDFAPRAKWADCPGCPKCAATDGLVLLRGAWRQTRAHESVFMLAKSMDYFCDGEAVKEAASHGNHRRTVFDNGPPPPPGAPPHTGLRHAPGADAGRNPRSFMLLSPEPLREAHYAAMPTALVEPLILASTSARGCCAKCGAPWARVVERGNPQGNNFGAGGGEKAEASEAERLAGGLGRMDGGRRATAGSTFNNNPAARPAGARTFGWRATCACDAGAGDPVPATVLDPFAGSGTTGAVAARLGRRAILCDLSQTYLRDIAPSRVGRAALAGQVSRAGAATQADLW